MTTQWHSTMKTESSIISRRHGAKHPKMVTQEMLQNEKLFLGAHKKILALVHWNINKFSIDE